MRKHDLVIVGAGPAGIAAAAHAHANGMDYVLLERTDHLADTIYCYQKGKHVMAEPALIPQRGEIPFAAGSRESILAAWQEFVERHGLRVEYRHELTALTRGPDGLRLATSGGEIVARRMILAVGTQGNPRRMGVEGEDLPHVSTRLVDPDDFEGKTIVVVGAGDSALEVALALCENNRTYLVVRKAELARAKEALIRDALKRAASGQLEILYSTNPRRVRPGGIVLTGPQADLDLDCDQVICKIGAQPPRGLLESFGIEFASEDPEAKPTLSASYESTVPGLYVIGATTGRDLIKFGMNHGFEVVEHVLGRAVVPADEELLNERLPFWTGTARQRLVRVMDEIPLVGAVAGRPGIGHELRQLAAAEPLREIFLSVEAKSFRDGETIIRQNDYTDSVLCIVSGTVEILRHDEREGERKVAVLSAGDFFGEMGLVSGRRRSATALAVGEVRILEIPRKAMLRLIYSYPGVKRVIDLAFMLRAVQNYIFPQLPVGELWSLVAQAKTEKVDRDTVVFKEGDPGEDVFLIRAGQVKLSRRSGDREVVTCYLVAGNMFGEAALISPDPRTATATTIFPSELIRLPRQAFEAFVARYPGLEGALRRKLEADRLATLKEEATPGAGRVLDELIREEVVMGTDALLIDEYKCIRCYNCVRACEAVHDDGQARLSLTGITFANLLAPNSCWQCENPLCMLDCPPDALYRDARGEVRIRDNCIGCGNCETNCPYGNIFLVHPQPRFSLTDWLRSIFGAGKGSGSDRTVAVKCDLCSDLAGGPACVRSCPTGAAIRVKPEEYQQTVERMLVATTPGR